MATATDTTVRPLTDEELLDKVVPRWARVLNWMYEHSFGPLDRLVDRICAQPTKNMIEDFEAAEQAKEQQAAQS